MKTIKVLVATIVFLLYGWYIYSLAMKDSAIFNANIVSTSDMWYIRLGVILLLMFVVILYIANSIKYMPKWIVSIIGLLLILLGKYILLDTYIEGVYISDITAVIWVIICILTWFGILITKPVFEKWEYSNKVEIIEV